MKIYAVCTWNWENFRIEEWEVLKETEKTYVVKGDCTWTAKKSEMKASDYLLALTYEEAVEKLIDLLERRINGNIEKIERIKQDNEKYANKLKELKENKNNGN